MSNIKKITLSVVGVVLSITLLVISTVLAEEKIINPAIAIALVGISVVLVCIAIFYAAKIDYETGVYECRKCDHIFKPTFKAYFLGAHTIRARHLKCPKCGDRSWCKRRSTNKN